MKTAIATVVIAFAQGRLTPAVILSASSPTPWRGQPRTRNAVEKAQADAVAAYDTALREFKTLAKLWRRSTRRNGCRTSGQAIIRSRPPPPRCTTRGG